MSSAPYGTNRAGFERCLNSTRVFMWFDLNILSRSNFIVYLSTSNLNKNSDGTSIYYFIYNNKVVYIKILFRRKIFKIKNYKNYTFYIIYPTICAARR